MAFNNSTSFLKWLSVANKLSVILLMQSIMILQLNLTSMFAPVAGQTLLINALKKPYALLMGLTGLV